PFGIRGQDRDHDHDDPPRLRCRRRPGQARSCCSLARPGGNLTGINMLAVELAAKRLELLRELVPAGIRIAVFIAPTIATGTELRDVDSAGRAMGLQIRVLNVSTSREIDAAFATFVSERPDALFVGAAPFFTDRRVQLAQLAARHALPAIYFDRLNAE